MRQTLAMWIPVLVLLIGLVVILKMPRRALGPAPDEEMEERLQAMEDEVRSLRSELYRTTERLEFAERVLARIEPTRA